MPIITIQSSPPDPGSSAMSIRYLSARLAAWDSSAANGGAYVNYTGEFPGSYSVDVTYIDGTAKYCTDYYAKNATVVFNSTTGLYQTLSYFVFRQKTLDLTKKMTVRLSNPRFTGGWPMAAAMPFNAKDSVLELTPYENEIINKKTQVTLTVSYFIPDGVALCSTTVAVQDAIGKTTRKTSSTSYVSTCVCMCVCVCMYVCVCMCVYVQCRTPLGRPPGRHPQHHF
jgi:hypothetical protein